MKFLLVLLVAAVHGCASASISTRDDLQNDLLDFIKLVPLDKLQAIVLDHVANDAELQDWIKYTQTDDFKNILLSLEAIPEYLEFLTYLQHSGVHVYEVINQIHEAVNLPPLPIPSRHVAKRSPRTLNSMLDELIAILPRDKLRALFDDKKKNSAAFQAFIARIQSDEFQGIVKKLVAIPEYQALKQRLRDHGVDVDHYVDFIKALFGVD